MQSDLEPEIRQCLSVILGHAEGNLGEAIRRLDAMKGSVTGHLAHYLSKRSYQKAWIALEGGDPEKGVCGG